MKVLISAFKNFNNASNNYSAEVLHYIHNVDKIILDVVYDKCYEQMNKVHNLGDYDLIISLGEARSRNSLMLEIQAINLASCSIPDNAGILIKDEKIIINGKDILYTNVDVEKVKDIIEFSYDAGKYVCNNLYYYLLHYYPNKSIFIHIPNCYDSLYEYQKYAKIIENIIERLR